MMIEIEGRGGLLEDAGNAAMLLQGKKPIKNFSHPPHLHLGSPGPGLGGLGYLRHVSRNCCTFLKTQLPTKWQLLGLALCQCPADLSTGVACRSVEYCETLAQTHLVDDNW